MRIRHSTAVIGSVVAAAVVFGATGCAGTGPSTDHQAAPSATGTPNGRPAASDVGFSAADDLPATAQPVWLVSVSTLEPLGWTLDAAGTDPQNGVWTYRSADGAEMLVRQQQVTDLQGAPDDLTATKQLFTASDIPGDLHEQTLPRVGGGTVSVLAATTTDSGGTPALVVARMFSGPGVALVLRLSAPDPTVLHDGIVSFTKGTSVEID
jgi:hypothetical protein